MNRRIRKVFFGLTLACIPMHILPMASLTKCFMCCLGLNEQKLDEMASHHEDSDNVENLSAAAAKALQPKHNQKTANQEPTGWGTPTDPEDEEKK